jgi:formylglycine-generating enzyme required for sulfatase activity
MTVPADVQRRTGYRLPTEAEWEYACRSGSLTSRYFGLSTGLLGIYVHYNANSEERAWACGSLQPNDLGLFDMLGNVYEWCQDEHHSYGAGEGGEISEDRIKGESINENPRVLRGGAFYYLPASVRSAKRDKGAPSFLYFSYGFRPCRTYP